MPFKFPYTNFQELNLDWIIKKVKDLSKQIEDDSSIVSEYIDRLIAVEDKADNAEATATAADARATGANNTANSALTLATQAKQTAEIADLSTTLLGLKIGDLSSLYTTAKDTIVNAINEVWSIFHNATAVTNVTPAGTDPAVTYSNGVFTFDLPEGGDPDAVTHAELDAAIDDVEDTIDALTDRVDGLEDSIDELSEALDDKADVIIDTASDIIASFPDGTATPLKSLIVNMEPKQAGSGDPSPLNVRTISGWNGVTVTRTGKNMFSDSNVVGAKDATITSITITDTTLNGWLAHKVVVVGAAQSWGWRIRWENSRSVILPGQSYYLTMLCYGFDPGNTFYMTFGDPSGANPIVSTTRFTAQNIGNGVYRCTAHFTAKPADDEAWNYSNQVFQPYQQAAFSSEGTFIFSDLVITKDDFTSDDFAAYHGDHFQVTFGETVYSGTVDLINGTLIIDSAFIDLGTLSYTYYSDYNTFVAFLENKAIGEPPDYGKGMVCSAYPTSEFIWYSGYKPDKSIGGTDGKGIAIKDSSYTNVPDFKAAMDGVQLVYPLENPIIIQLTPQQIDALKGYNTVWSDAGSVDVTYKADTKGYIDKLIAQVQALALGG